MDLGPEMAEENCAQIKPATASILDSLIDYPWLCGELWPTRAGSGDK